MSAAISTVDEGSGCLLVDPPPLDMFCSGNQPIEW